jgi:ABC-type multidrug transport system fused ATPase/permease subunit
VSAPSTDSTTVPAVSGTNRDHPISDISVGETLYLLRRALAYILPLWRLLVVKIVLALIGVGCVLILPWPLKVVIDQVVMGIAPGASPTPYPPYVQPLIDQLIGLSPLGIVLAVVGFSLVLIFLIGAFGTGSSFQSSAQGGLAQGFDNATRSENMANESRSRVSGLLGLFEYRYQLRTTHLLNHRLRSDVFAGLIRMPMTRFSDVSIGDSVYRVMYDTPAVSNICFNLLVDPLIIFAVMATVIWTTEHSFYAVPSVVWIAWAVTPLVFFSMLILTGITRRRALASRIAGSATTATMEEGMANIAAVQALGASAREKQDFANDSDNSFKQYRYYQLVLQGAYVLQAIIVLPLVFYVLFDVAEATIEGTLSPGDYGVLTAYFVQLVTNALALARHSVDQPAGQYCGAASGFSGDRRSR